MQDIIKKSKERTFMISAKNCPYCLKAKEALNNINIKFDVYEIDLKDTKKKEEIIKVTKHNTFPQIFVNNVFIGGYTELMSLILTNSLYSMLGICPDF